MFLSLDPTDTNPWLLINRDEERKALVGRILHHFVTGDGRRGLTWSVVGDKGVGKSIFTQAVLRDVRSAANLETAIIQVDCRGKGSWRAVLAEVADQCVVEIDALSGIPGNVVPKGLLATARVGAAFARFDGLELRDAHERLLQFKGALELGGNRSLLSFLSSGFQVGVQREKSHTQAIEGRIVLDASRLGRAIAALLRDMRTSGLRVIVLLDNVDELDHRYRTEGEREHVRQEVEGLLGLREAPVVLLVNVRTYFNGVLTRAMMDRTLLRPLRPSDLQTLLQRRMEFEDATVQAAFRDPTMLAAAQALAARVGNPLAWLYWVKFLVERDLLSESRFEEGCHRFLDTYFTQVNADDVSRVVRVFTHPEGDISREDLLAACGNTYVMSQMEDHQVVEPRDFWNPVRYQLDPLFHVLHPRAGHST